MQCSLMNYQFFLLFLLRKRDIVSINDTIALLISNYLQRLLATN